VRCEEAREGATATATTTDANYHHPNRPRAEEQEEERTALRATALTASEYGTSTRKQQSLLPPNAQRRAAAATVKTTAAMTDSTDGTDRPTGRQSVSGLVSGPRALLCHSVTGRGKGESSAALTSESGGAGRGERVVRGGQWWWCAW
jgi:hypothetical protein